MSTAYKVKYIKVDGFQIGIRNNAYNSSKKTILLIHGIGTSSDYYIPLMEEFDNDYNVYAIDLPGYGKTNKPAHALTIDELAEVAESFLESRQLTDVIAVGHSMGAQIVSSLNYLSPGRVQKAILLAPTVNKNERTIFMQSLRLAQDTLLEPPKVNAIIFLNYLRMGVVRFLKTSKYMVEAHLEEYLKDTTTPVLVILGQKDPIARKQWADYLTTISPTISTQIIAKAPHAFHYTHAKEVKDLCQVFIEN